MTLQELKFETRKNDVLSLTEEIQRVVTESGVRNGTCVIHSPHTTAGVTSTSKWDETDFADIKSEMRRIVPTYHSPEEVNANAIQAAEMIAAVRGALKRLREKSAGPSTAVPSEERK